MKKIVILISFIVIILSISGCGSLTNIINELEDTGNINGTVVFTDTNDPIEGVTINIAGTTLEATTNANGIFAFSDLEYGTYTLNATKDDINTTKEVIINTPNTNVIIELGEASNPAKLLVNDFTEGMYRMGTIYTEESSIVQGQFEDEMIPFIEKIGPYMEDVENGLYHIEVIDKKLGEYNSRLNEWDYYEYELINHGDPNADNWTWIVHDEENGLTVTISTPNTDQMTTKNDNETEITVDLTNATFEYTIASEEHLDTVYTATLNIGNENVETFTVYFEDYVYDENSEDYVETTYTYNFLIPTGPTAELNCEIDLDSNDKIDEIIIEATFDVPSLSDDLELVLDGTLTTPVFTYEGKLEFEIETSNDGFNINIPKPFTFSGKGTLTTDTSTVEGTFLATFKIIEIVYKDENEEYICYKEVPSYIEISGNYKSATTFFEGTLSYECTNLNSWIDSGLGDGFFNIIGSLNHTVVNNEDDEYDLNVTITPADYDIFIEFDFSKNDFTLAGEVNYNDEDGLTTISFEDHRGTSCEVEIPDTDEEVVGYITDSDGNVCAEARLVEEMDALMITYSDSGDYEYIPLNPLEYLPGQ